MGKHNLLLGLLLALWLAVLPACGPAETEPQLATDLNEMSLTEMWTTVVEQSSIQGETAIVESLQLSASAGAALERAHLVVHALDEEGHNQALFVDVDSGGDLTWRQQQVSRGDYALHPSTLLSALDRAALEEMAAEQGGLTVLADTIAGDVSYRQEHADVYLLEDGELRPLQEIVFHSESPWTTITVCAPAPEDGREVRETEGGAVVTRTVQTGEGNQCKIWFLEQTAAGAAVLETAASPTATPTTTP